MPTETIVSTGAGTALGGFYLPLADPATGTTAFGAGVAGRTFIQALLRHGHFDRMEFFAPAAVAEKAQAEYDAVSRTARSRTAVRVHGPDDLARGLDSLGITAWHDIDARVRRPFSVRRQMARRPFPVTVTHHTFSYSDMLYDWFLPLLLGDSRAYDSIVCTSSTARQAIAALLDHVRAEFERSHGARLQYRGRLDVIPLGVDIEMFRPRDKADARYQLGLPVDALMLLWLGRLSPADKADLMPLVTAFAGLVKANPEKPLALALAGTPTVEARRVLDHGAALGVRNRLLVREAEPRVRHLFHAAADIFVSPVDNIQETFGITPIEAMASGVPVVASDWDGYRDTVVHGETGFLVPTYWARCDGDLGRTAQSIGDGVVHFALGQSVVVDLSALERALQDLIDDPDLRRRMGEAGRLRAKSLYDWRVVIGRYESLWHELADACRTEGSPEGPAQGFLDPPYATAFAGYATRMVSDATSLRLTALGQRVATRQESFPLLHKKPGAMSIELIRSALAAVSDRSTEATGPTLGELVIVLANKSGEDPDRVRRHLLWLAKYSLVQLRF